MTVRQGRAGPDVKVLASVFGVNTNAVWEFLKEDELRGFWTLHLVKNSTHNFFAR